MFENRAINHKGRHIIPTIKRRHLKNGFKKTLAAFMKDVEADQSSNDDPDFATFRSIVDKGSDLESSDKAEYSSNDDSDKGSLISAQGSSSEGFGFGSTDDLSDAEESWSEASIETEDASTEASFSEDAKDPSGQDDCDMDIQSDDDNSTAAGSEIGSIHIVKVETISEEADTESLDLRISDAQSVNEETYTSESEIQSDSLAESDSNASNGNPDAEIQYLV